MFLKDIQQMPNIFSTKSKCQENVLRLQLFKCLLPLFSGNFEALTKCKTEFNVFGYQERYF